MFIHSMWRTGSGPRIALGVVAASAFLLLFSGCGVTGLRSAAKVDLLRVYENVQTLPNSTMSPDCNVDFCAVLFTDANVQIYEPRVVNRGAGSPANYDLSSLRPYETSDGGVLFAPYGWNPNEYRTESGEIRIQFPFGMGKEDLRGRSTFQ